MKPFCSLFLLVIRVWDLPVLFLLAVRRILMHSALEGAAIICAGLAIFLAKGKIVCYTTNYKNQVCSGAPVRAKNYERRLDTGYDA